jgi:general secretion pathway protein D
VVITQLDRVVRIVSLLVVLAVLTGCAASKSYQQAGREMRRENYDQAVLLYSKALAKDPGNDKYTMALARAKLQSAAEHFKRGQRFQNANQLDLAVAEYQQVLLMMPDNQHAAQEMDKAVQELRRRQAGPSEIEQLKERARRRDSGPPKLDPRSNIPILLDFKDIEIGKIFEALGKASGINFIFDEKVDLEKPLSIDLGNVTLEKALDILMLRTKNFYMVIDEYTLLVAPDTRQKRQEYEDQVIRTFFLSNAETKTVVTLLRSLLQSRQIAENADLNSVTIKDTPAKVAIADRIINANDKSKGEVVIEVELLEIDRTVARTVGIDLSSKTLSMTFRDGMASLPLNNLGALSNSAQWSVGVIPSVILNFLKSDSNTKLIAKPQLRVAEGERAEILIGDRVPIPTTSFNTSQTIGGNIVPITSFTYQNVGITVQIEPRVHHNREVTLNVQVEISQVTGVVETTAGQAQPIIGTRQIQTVIRLRDGETNMLAGLIQRQDTDNLSGVIGIADIPGLRRVFASNEREVKETDIVMTLTPRIIRIPNITEDDLMTMWVGTEENMQLRGSLRNTMSQGPFAGGPVVSAADVVSGGGAAGAAAPPSGGSVSQISSSPEAQRASPRSSGAAGASGPGSRPSQSGTQTAPPPIVAPPPGSGTEPPPGTTGEDKPDEDREKPTGPAVVSLIPNAQSFGVGDVIIVEVRVDNAQNVGSIPFHLRYNTDVLQFISPAGEGSFMNNDGANTVFLASDTGGGGEIVVGLSRLGVSEGATGAGSLATFQFQAVNPGNCGFAFTGASVKDPQARNLPAAFNAANVEVQP